MAQYGDLQVPGIDAHADEQAEQTAQDPIQDEREHRSSSDRLPGVAASGMSRGRSNLLTPHALTRHPCSLEERSHGGEDPLITERRGHCSR